MSYFHEEQRFSWWIFALVAVLAVPAVVVVLAAAVGPPAPGLPFLALMLVPLLIIVLFALAKLVVDVDERGIHIGFHFLWPTRDVRLSDVASATATRYNALLEYGGWGVRLSPRGWSFNTGGSEGVLLRTKTGKRFMIGSHRARDLEAAIAQAIAARGGPA